MTINTNTIPTSDKPTQGQKVVRDATTQNNGNVKLGDAAPAFGPK